MKFSTEKCISFHTRTNLLLVGQRLLRTRCFSEDCRTTTINDLSRHVITSTLKTTRFAWTSKTPISSMAATVLLQVKGRSRCWGNVDNSTFFLLKVHRYSFDTRYAKVVQRCAEVTMGLQHAAWYCDGTLLALVLHAPCSAAWVYTYALRYSSQQDTIRPPHVLATGIWGKSCHP